MYTKQGLLSSLPLHVTMSAGQSVLSFAANDALLVMKTVNSFFAQEFIGLLQA